MKKLMFLSAFVFLSQTALASDSCIEKEVFAVNSEGVCETFNSLCEIPEDSKQVPSCDLIEKKKPSLSMEDKLNKRFSRKKYTRRNYTSKKTEEIESDSGTPKTTGKYKRQGRGYLTRTGNYRKTRLNEKQGTNYNKRKTFTRKNYSKATREKIKKLNIQKGGFQHEDDLTKEERAERRASRPGIRSATRMNRSGYLSSQPKFSTTLKERSESAKIGSERQWKSLKQTSRKKKSRAKRTVELRRKYKGERLEGDLSDSLID